MVLWLHPQVCGHVVGGGRPEAAGGAAQQEDTGKRERRVMEERRRADGGSWSWFSPRRRDSVQRNHSVFGWRHVVAANDNKPVNRQLTPYWEHWALTGSCERRTPESSSCCRDTADSARETGSGPRSPRQWLHTPHTSAVPGPSGGSCRAQHRLICPWAWTASVPPPQTCGLTCFLGLCGSAALWGATAGLWSVQGRSGSGTPAPPS